MSGKPQASGGNAGTTKRQNMTKKQMREHKAGIARRRAQILSQSKGKKLGENLCIYLGGVGQKGKR